MLRLSDAELSTIMHLATPIPVQMRAAFLKAIARELGGREPGAGLVHRIARDLQPRFIVAVPRPPRVPPRYSRRDAIREPTEI